MIFCSFSACASIANLQRLSAGWSGGVLESHSLTSTLLQEQGKQSKIMADMLLSREHSGDICRFTWQEWVCPWRALRQFFLSGTLLQWKVKTAGLPGMFTVLGSGKPLEFLVDLYDVIVSSSTSSACRHLYLSFDRNVMRIRVNFTSKKNRRLPINVFIGFFKNSSDLLFFFRTIFRKKISQTIHKII
jgi:hypothetical protein